MTGGREGRINSAVKRESQRRREGRSGGKEWREGVEGRSGGMGGRVRHRVKCGHLYIKLGQDG